MTFNEECTRKGRMLDLLIELENAERVRMKDARKKDQAIKYQKMFRDVVKVVGVKSHSVRLVRENGKKLIALAITPEIAGLMRIDDHLGLTAGYCSGAWRLISIEAIGSHLEDGQMHLSAPNPGRVLNENI